MSRPISKRARTGDPALTFVFEKMGTQRGRRKRTNPHWNRQTNRIFGLIERVKERPSNPSAERNAPDETPVGVSPRGLDSQAINRRRGRRVIVPGAYQTFFPIHFGKGYPTNSTLPSRRRSHRQRSRGGVDSARILCANLHQMNRHLTEPDRDPITQPNYGTRRPRFRRHGSFVFNGEGRWTPVSVARELADDDAALVRRAI